MIKQNGVENPIKKKAHQNENKIDSSNDISKPDGKTYSEIYNSYECPRSISGLGNSKISHKSNSSDNENNSHEKTTPRQNEKRAYSEDNNSENNKQGPNENALINSSYNNISFKNPICEDQNYSIGKDSVNVPKNDKKIDLSNDISKPDGKTDSEIYNSYECPRSISGLGNSKISHKSNSSDNENNSHEKTTPRQNEKRAYSEDNNSEIGEDGVNVPEKDKKIGLSNHISKSDGKPDSESYNSDKEQRSISGLGNRKMSHTSNSSDNESNPHEKTTPRKNEKNAYSEGNNSENNEQEPNENVLINSSDNNIPFENPMCKGQNYNIGKDGVNVPEKDKEIGSSNHISKSEEEVNLKIDNCSLPSDNMERGNVYDNDKKLNDLANEGGDNTGFYYDCDYDHSLEEIPLINFYSFPDEPLDKKESNIDIPQIKEVKNESSIKNNDHGMHSRFSESSRDEKSNIKNKVSLNNAFYGSPLHLDLQDILGPVQPIV